MAIEREAHATWEHGLRRGTGTFDLRTSGSLTGQPVTWVSRFEEPGGKTSPEELIAAAHATCFSMALANGLTRDGHEPTKLETDARVTLDDAGGSGYAITNIVLTVRGEVEGLDEGAFREAAEKAKENCPVSKALASVPEIKLDASLA